MKKNANLRGRTVFAYWRESIRISISSVAKTLAAEHFFRAIWKYLLSTVGQAFLPEWLKSILKKNGRARISP